MEDPPCLDRFQTPCSAGVKKIPQFVGYDFVVTMGGGRWFWCISPDHGKDLEVWLRLLKFDLEAWMGRGESIDMRGNERRRSGARGWGGDSGSLAGWCSREEVMGRRGGLYREEGGENYSVWWGKESQSELS